MTASASRPPIGARVFARWDANRFRQAAHVDPADLRAYTVVDHYPLNETSFSAVVEGQTGPSWAMYPGDYLTEADHADALQRARVNAARARVTTWTDAALYARLEVLEDTDYDDLTPEETAEAAAVEDEIEARDLWNHDDARVRESVGNYGEPRR